MHKSIKALLITLLLFICTCVAEDTIPGDFTESDPVFGIYTNIPISATNMLSDFWYTTEYTNAVISSGYLVTGTNHHYSPIEYMIENNKLEDTINRLLSEGYMCDVIGHNPIHIGNQFYECPICTNVFVLLKADMLLLQD